MMISIPSCGDNQIILMVKQAAIDLKYYCAKGGMWLRLGPNIPSTFTLYIKHFFWRNAYNKEFETYVGGFRPLAISFFSNKHKVCQRFPIADSNRKFLLCFV